MAVQLLHGTHRLEADDPPTAGAGLGPVTLTTCGTLDVGRPGGHPGTTADELLGQVLRNARRLPTHPKPEQLALLHRLEDAAAASSLGADVRAHMLQTAVADTLGPGAGERLTGQLGQLVEACAHLAGAARPAVPDVHRQVGPASAAGPVPGGAPAASGSPLPSARRGAPARPASSRHSRRGRARVSRRRRALGVLIMVAVLAAGAGYAMLRGPGGDVMAALGLGGGTAVAARNHAEHPSKQPSGHPHAQERRAVPVLAARHTGAVTGVVLHRTGACRPGALCPVKVTVHLRPSATSRTVSWKIGAVRLCKRGLSWSPPTTVTARPGWTSVYATSVARAPTGRSLALVALTTAPARAQSRPVPVTGSGLHC
ncbi:hypothetical protein [Nocardioides koreensis]|uniref:hypothetical protein n=1 Tax=Nocardioides koreensis TaxID=433651 RepID=UPI0031D8071C